MRISDRHLEAIYLLGIGFKKCQVAEILGLNEATIYDWLRQPEFQREQKKFREERRQAFLKTVPGSSS